MRCLTLLVVLLSAPAVCDADDPSAPQPGRVREPGGVPPRPLDAEPRVPIGFEGLLPGSTSTRLEGSFEVLFRIYRAPQGGKPLWEEKQTVKVERGRMRVVAWLSS